MMKNVDNLPDVPLNGKKKKMLLSKSLKNNKRIKKVDRRELSPKKLNKKVSSTSLEIEMPEMKFLMIQKKKKLKNCKENAIWILIQLK